MFIKNKIFVVYFALSSLILAGCNGSSSENEVDKFLSGGTTTSTSATASLPTSAVALLISGNVSSGTVGTCYGPFTVTSVNLSNSSASLTASKSVLLTLSGSGLFYSDSGCSTSSTSVTISAGSSSSTFYYQGTAPGFQTFYVTATELGSSSFPFNLQAGSPVSIAVAGTDSVGAGSCSSAITATLKDSASNSATATGATTVNLSTGGAGGFYSDSACTVGIASVSITAGSSAKTFYFKDAIAETTSITVASAGLTSGTFSITVSAATVATKILISASNAYTTAGTCYGPLTLTSADNGNSAVAVGANTAVALSSSGSSTFYSDAACTSSITSKTISTGSSSASIYIKSTLAETQNLFASATGLTGATYSFTILADAPAVLVITGSASLAGNACSGAYTVTLKDANGNVSKSSGTTTVALGGAGSGTYYSDSSCSSSSSTVSIVNNSATGTFYFKDPTGESITMSAASGALTSGMLAVAISSPSSPTHLNISVSPAYGNAGTCLGPILVKTTDSGGSALVTSTNKTVTLSGASNGAFYLDAACSSASGTVTINSGTSQSSVYYKNDIAENLLFSASAAGLTDGTYPFTVTSAAATKLTISGSSSLNSGVCSAIYTVYHRDALNNLKNAASNLTVNLSGGGSGTFYSDDACSSSTTIATISSGTSSTTFYFKDSTAESLTLTAATGSLTNGTLALTINAGTATQLTITAPSSAAAGLCSSAFTITSKDSNSNTASVSGNKTVTLGGASAGGFYSDSGCTSSISNLTITNGTSSGTFYFKDTTAETVTLTASTTGLAQGSQSYTTTANVLTKIVLSGASTSTAYNCSATTIVATTTDTYGNAFTLGSNTLISLSGEGSGAFYSDAGCTSSITDFTITNGNSAGSFYYKSNAQGSLTFTASSAGITSGTRAFTVSGQTATKVVITGTAAISTRSCTAYTAQIQDTTSNPVVQTSNLSVTLSGTSYGYFYSDAACTTTISSLTITAASSSQIFYFKDVIGENVTISAASAGLTTGTKAITQTAQFTLQESLAGGYHLHGYREGTGTYSRFYNPKGVVADANYIYVTDLSNNVIRRIDIATGVTTLLAGLPNNAGSTDASGTNARLNQVAGIVIIGAHIYYTDYNAQQIKKLDLSTNTVSTIAGTYNTSGTANGTGAAARFNGPYSITTDGTNMYVGEVTGNCVRKVTTAGVVTTVTGTCGSANAYTDSATAANVRFKGIYGIAIDPTTTYLYVADYGNNVIRKVTISTGETTTFSGSLAGTAGSTDGTGTAAFHNGPTGLTSDGTYLYVSDAGTGRIRRISHATAGVQTIAGSSLGVVDGVGASAKFLTLRDLAVSNDGLYLFIADYGASNIRKLRLSDWTVTTVAGASETHYINRGVAGAIDSFGVASQFNNPTGIVELNGYIYVADYSNYKIRKINIRTSETETLAGTGTASSVDSTFAGASFNAPYGITTDGTDLYVSEYTGSCIRKLTLSSQTVTTLSGRCGTVGNVDGNAATARYQTLQHIVYDSGYIYTTELTPCRIRKVSVADGTSTHFSGSTAAACAVTDGTGGAGTARYSSMLGFATDGTYLYMAENTAAGKIRRIDLSTGDATTIAGSTSGYNDATGTSAKFNSPRSMWYYDGYLYIYDFTNNAIRKMNTTTYEVTTLAGVAPPGIQSYADYIGGSLTQIPSGIRGLFVSHTGLFYSVHATDAFGVRWIH